MGPTITNELQRLVAEREEQLRMEVHSEELDHVCVNVHSPTWKAILQKIKEMVEHDYMPTLRNRDVNQERTQYARGAMDALESLLELGGESL